MSVRACVASTLLLAAAGCAGRTGVETRPIKPENGPKASFYARVYGVSFHRELEASFRLDEPGYVLVGHLGGDGMIRVVYPESPEAGGTRVQPRTWVRTDKIEAIYDAAPHRFTFASEPIRGIGAEMDSYDGRGHGFVFLITSRQPLNLGPVMDGFEFGELDVKDYGSMLDPRLAVRRIADAVAGPNGYTLKFANAYSTTNYASTFNRFGCGNSYSRAFGRYYDPFYFGFYDHLAATPLFRGSWGMPTWYVLSWESPRLRCGHGYALTYYRVLHAPWTFNSSSVFPWIEPTGTVVPPITRTLTRLRPTIGDSGRAVAKGGRSAIDRHTIVTRQREGGATSDILTRMARRAGLIPSATETVTRTHAASFDRPGATRVLDENRRRYAQRPLYYSRDFRPPARRDGFDDWMRGRSDRPSYSGSQDQSGSTTASASSGTGSSGGTAASRGTSSGTTGRTPVKH